MPNALVSSLAVLEDVEGASPVVNVDTDWLYLSPMTIVWADKIFVPSRYATDGQQFHIDVGYDKSNEVISESTSNVWNRLVKEGINRYPSANVNARA